MAKFSFFYEICIFWRNLDFLMKFRFFDKIYIFWRNLHFLTTFTFFDEIYIFLLKFTFIVDELYFFEYFCFWMWYFWTKFDFFFLAKVPIVFRKFRLIYDYFSILQRIKKRLIFAPLSRINFVNIFPTKELLEDQIKVPNSQKSNE